MIVLHIIPEKIPLDLRSTEYVMSDIALRVSIAAGRKQRPDLTGHIK